MPRTGGWILSDENPRKVPPKIFKPPLRKFSRTLFSSFYNTLMCGSEVAKSRYTLFKAKKKKIDPGLRPGSIFFFLALSFEDNDKFWWLVFIGRITGSGNAPQEADIGL